jgi:hypothetical protein
LLNVNKFCSPGQKNQCYLFCIMRKFVQCGKYFRSHAVPPYTSFTVLPMDHANIQYFYNVGKMLTKFVGAKKFECFFISLNKTITFLTLDLFANKILHCRQKYRYLTSIKKNYKFMHRKPSVFRFNACWICVCWLE